MAHDFGAALERVGGAHPVERSFGGQSMAADENAAEADSAPMDEPLGISRRTLDRWLAAGRVPTILTPNGMAPFLRHDRAEDPPTAEAAPGE